MNLLYSSLLVITSLYSWVHATSFMNKLQTIRTKQDTLIGTSQTGSFEYFDAALWRKKQFRQLVYEPREGKFTTNTVDIFKFKYGDTSDNHSGESTNQQRRRNRRSVSIFGIDDRVKIVSSYVEKYPFAYVVRLENGCTGTLIWSQHVLTAAHCVHNHTHVNPPLNKLRIGFLNGDSTFDWIGATQVYVPPSWLKRNKALKYFNHDYAVIKLSRPHNREWMSFGALNIRENQILQFTGFPTDKKANEMWISLCSVVQSHKHVLVNHCDAAPGMSGSGVYVYNKVTEKRTIVGVFSSFIHIEGNERNSFIDFSANVATHLTKKKVERICKWIGAGSDCQKLHQPSVARSFLKNPKL